MFRLSLIFSVVHFALACGLRRNFSRTENWNPELAGKFEVLSERIEFVLTQPGRWVCDALDIADGSAGFWILMALTSILWGNILAIFIKRVLGTLFR